MKFSNLWYDRLKWLALIAIPALSTFLSTVLPMWGCGESYTLAITRTLSAFALLLGTLIGVSCFNYTGDNDDGN